MKAAIPDNSYILRSFPELQRIPCPRDRGVLWRAAFRAVRWRFFVFVVLLAAVAVLLSTITGITLLPHLAPYVSVSRPAITGFVGGFAGGLLVPLVFFVGLRVFHRKLRRAVRQQLVGRGVAVCITCCYNLSGLTHPRCPECGSEFDLRLLGFPNTGGTHD